MRKFFYGLLAVLVFACAHKPQLPPPDLVIEQDTRPTMEIEWVFVKGDTFFMGPVLEERIPGIQTMAKPGRGELPRHPVVLSDYYLSATEVTFAQFDSFCIATGRELPYDFGYGRGNRPVVNVIQPDAVAFCEWLSLETGYEVRLPTEAEWEFAARSGGREEKWAGTNIEDALKNYAWTSENSNRQTHPVGLKHPNGLGLYDMSGNVWEICSDYYDERYYEKGGVPDYTRNTIRFFGPVNNPQGPEKKPFGTNNPVMRGGSWKNLAKDARTARRAVAGVRKKGAALSRGLLYGSDQGFRVARTP